MGIEDGGLQDVIVEPSEDEDERCPCCGSEKWMRAVAAYRGGTCFVIYCSDCGKPTEERWNIIP